MRCKTCNDRKAVTGTNQCKRCWRRDYRQINKVHIRKTAHARYVKNREHIRAKAHEKYQQNPKHFIEMAHKSIKKNYVRVRKYNKARYWKNRGRELIRNRTRETFGHLLKTGSCQTCGSKEKLTFHHIEPYQYDVFQILCYKCHGRIHGKNHFVYESKGVKPWINII